MMILSAHLTKLRINYATRSMGWCGKSIPKRWTIFLKRISPFSALIRKGGFAKTRLSLGISSYKATTCKHYTFWKKHIVARWIASILIRRITQAHVTGSIIMIMWGKKMRIVTANGFP